MGASLYVGKTSFSITGTCFSSKQIVLSYILKKWILYMGVTLLQ